MPWDEVMSKWSKGTLRSGSKNGPHVASRKQAVAIMLSEKRKAQGGRKEYARTGLNKALSKVGTRGA